MYTGHLLILWSDSSYFITIRQPLRVVSDFRSKVGQKGPLFEEFFEYAVAYRTSWLERGFDTPLLNKIVFEKIKRSFGGRLEVCMHFLY